MFDNPIIILILSIIGSFNDFMRFIIGMGLQKINLVRNSCSLL